MRYFFEIAYKGTNYHGWQKQLNAISVQGVLEKTLSTFFRDDISITGSGRTDTGVHCEQQYFHADLKEEFESEEVIYRLNTFLPADISIRSIRKVKPDAHARFDALERRYEYRISRVKNPFLNETAYKFLKDLNISDMNLAAAVLLEHSDFQSFSKIKTDAATFNCNITRAEWVLDNDLIIFYVSANRFLRGMVRAITGTLLDVGMGKSSISDFEEIIKSKDRKRAGVSTPSEGLFLTRVNYPDSIFI